MIDFIASMIEDICKLYFVNGDLNFSIDTMDYVGPNSNNLVHYSVLHWNHHLIHDAPKEIIELKAIVQDLKRDGIDDLKKQIQNMLDIQNIKNDIIELKNAIRT